MVVRTKKRFGIKVVVRYKQTHERCHPTPHSTLQPLTKNCEFLHSVRHVVVHHTPRQMVLSQDRARQPSPTYWWPASPVSGRRSTSRWPVMPISNCNYHVASGAGTRTLHNVERLLRVALGVGVVVVRSLALHVDHGSVHVPGQPRSATPVSQQQSSIPLGQRHEKVAAGALVLKGRDVEPVSLAVVGGARGGGDGVAHDLVAGAGGLELGGGAEVADDADAREGARGGRAKGTRRGAGGGGAGRGAEECRHGAGWGVG